MKRKRSCIAVVLFFVIFYIHSNISQAAYPSFNAKNPLVGYGWQKKNYKVYEMQKLTGTPEVLSYNICNISKISNGVVKITYKSDDEKESEGWAALKQFIYDPSYPMQSAYTNHSFVLYKRPTIREQYLVISQYSGGMIVSEKGNWFQVIFKSNGKYYLGWMRKSSYLASIRLSMNTTTQPLADGTYTIIPTTKTKAALTYDVEEGKLFLDKNNKSENQKFRLQYKTNQYYSITLIDSKYSLSEQGIVKNSSSSQNMWKLVRSGGAFYLRNKKSQKVIARSGGKFTVEDYKAAKTQKWLLTKIEESPEKETSVVFSQYDPKWGGSTYYQGPTRKTISSSGCGVMALTNAVYALNGEFISPTKIADFSASRGYYYYNQGTSDTLYRDFATIYGKTYHFRHVGKTYSLKDVQEKLKQGSVAVALVPGHYLAIVAYREKDDMYLVLDSAVYGKRPTTIYGDWVSSSTLRRGTMSCSYFHMFARRVTTQ